MSSHHETRKDARTAGSSRQRRVRLVAESDSIRHPPCNREERRTIEPRLFVLLALCLTAFGCHTVDVRSSADPHADFSVYNTYNFAEPLAPKGSPYLTEQNRQTIEVAVRGEMEKRGCRLADQPDLLFSIRLQASEQTYDKSTPAVESGSMASNLQKHYTLLYNDSSRTQRVVNYTEGTLGFLAVDRKKDQVVWEGIAMGVLHRDRTPEQVQERIHEAVRAVFDKFPAPPNRK